MRTIRIFFSKKGEASYISHLDLQRVMGRALRRSGLPVWYSMGFNPHIYISFALPLPLMQESVVEAMDCKTEADDADFDRYIEPLNKALPKGIEVSRIAVPMYKAGDIETATYQIEYDNGAKSKLAEVVEKYNSLQQAMVLRKTKRKEEMYDLKSVLPVLRLLEGQENTLLATLPAGNTVNINPELLLTFLRDTLLFIEEPKQILRTRVCVAGGKDFT